MHARLARASPPAPTSGSTAPGRTMLRSRRPVSPSTAVRTGVGQEPDDPLPRAGCSRDRGLRVVAIRHPDALRRPRRPGVPALRDLRRPRPVRVHHRGARGVRAAPRRRRRRLRRRRLRARSCAQAEQEADVILWDGGNNDLPFYVPDLHIVLADPLRPGDEAALPPRRDERPDGRRRRHQQVRLGTAGRRRGRRGLGPRELNPRATVLRADSPVPSTTRRRRRAPRHRRRGRPDPDPRRR